MSIDKIPRELDSLLDSKISSPSVKIQSGLSEVLDAPEAFQGETPRTKPDVRDYVVAFLDVLGTSSLMESIEKQGITEREISDIYYKSIAIEEIFQRHLNSIKDKLGDELKYMVISDSFVIAVPDSLDAIIALVIFIKEFQYSCLKEIAQPLRGAVTKGKIIGNITKNKIIGSAFTKAHKAEGKIALYPRIILDPKIADSFSSNERWLISKDRDGIFYVDFVGDEPNADLLESVETSLNNETEFSSERQKWDWLHAYLVQKYSPQTKKSSLPIKG